LVFVLDRDSGEPVWPVEERPVPAGGVAGERTAATQPFPLRPPPLLPARLRPEDAWGFTPWDRADCREQVRALRHEGLFTAITGQWTLMYPGSLGGPNWGGGALDPVRGLLLVNFNTVPARARLVPQAAGGERGQVSIEGYEWRMVMSGTPWVMETGMLVSPLGAPCSAPPWGALTALDLASGEWRWRVPLGSIHEMGPLPLPFEIPLGTPNLGGGLLTAGGLLFIAATTDRTLRAFDVESGEVLWRARLPADAHATPLSYVAGGRQFVVIAAGGHHMFDRRPKADALLAFALPGG
jgi:quinoprotein glucose dehydrogenase